MGYPHVLAFVREHPWAIRPETLETVCAVLSLRLRGERLTDEEIAARLGAVPPRQDRPAAPPSIAVIPVWGVVAHRAGSLAESSGGTSTERLGALLRQAGADPSVQAIVLDVDSPGGSVFGVPELADQIHAMRATKPVYAIANAQAASAAYWLASQASELIVTPSGEVGSIGVLAVHEDASALHEKIGLKVSYVAAGKYKTEGNPHEPLGEEARANLQARVNTYYDAFVRAVARGRSVPLREVREGFGEGRMVGAAQAQAIGMVDRAESFEAALERIARKASRSTRAAAAGSTWAMTAGTSNPTVTCATTAEPPARAPIVEPDEDGECPDGYEKRDDGLCHLMPEDDAAARAEMDRRRRRLRLAESA